MALNLLQYGPMQISVTHTTDTEIELTVVASEKELAAVKEHVLGHYRSSVKIPGFRAGKAPSHLLEKQLNPNELQASFLEEAINQMYPQAMNTEGLRPVDNPEVSIKKFVPFNELEFTAKVLVIGEVKLGKYKGLSVARTAVSVSAEEVTSVLKNLQTRMAEKVDVERAAKDGDQVWIDFSGKNAKGEPVNGADGKDYPLLLGSKTFIPGFEENLVGLSAGEEKEFTIPFPKDYGVKALAGKKVTFSVQVKKVQEVKEPKLDDEFAAKAGPFTSLKALKDDVKKQLEAEKQQEADRTYENDLIQKIAENSSVALPDILIDQQLDRVEEEEKRNLTYRGQTWQEHLDEEGVTEAEHRAQKRPAAELRVRAGIMLSEIAEKEGLEVTPEELEVRMQLLQGQYKDAQMQAQLQTVEARRDIASRILTEKTIARLVELNKK